MMAVALVLVMPLPALAYLDPVSGSFMAQGLIAGVLAVLASIRSLRRRLRQLFFPGSSTTNAEDASDAKDNA